MFYLLQEWPRILPISRIRSCGHGTSRTTKLLAGGRPGDVRVPARQLSVMLLLAVFLQHRTVGGGPALLRRRWVMTGLLVFIPFVGFSASLCWR